MIRFFLRTGDTAIDSSRRGKKSTLVGDDMAYMVGVISAAASWGSGTVKGGTRLDRERQRRNELALEQVMARGRASKQAAAHAISIGSDDGRTIVIGL